LQLAGRGRGRLPGRRPRPNQGPWHYRAERVDCCGCPAAKVTAPRELEVKEDGMHQHQPGIQAHWHRARGNREYVRRLLSQRQPEFFAVLQSTERQIHLELSCETGD
jgi:hypothetical protein